MNGKSTNQQQNATNHVSDANLKKHWLKRSMRWVLWPVYIVTACYLSWVTAVAVVPAIAVPLACVLGLVCAIGIFGLEVIFAQEQEDLQQPE